jgi:hypothetical protein
LLYQFLMNIFRVSLIIPIHARWSGTINITDAIMRGSFNEVERALLEIIRMNRRKIRAMPAYPKGTRRGVPPQREISGTNLQMTIW